jgi:hypothetical protein
MVAEAAVGQDRDRHARGQHLGQPDQALVLVIIACLLQLGLADRAPQQRRCPAVSATAWLSKKEAQFLLARHSNFGLQTEGGIEASA